MNYIDKSGKHTISISRIVIECILILVTIGIALLMYFVLPDYFNYNRADAYARYMFPVIAFPFNSLSNFFMQSLTELFAVVGGIALLITVIIFFIKTICKILKYGPKGACKYALIRLRIVTTIVMIGTILFQLMIGINYNRTPVSGVLELDGRGYEGAEYIEVLDWAYTEMIAARRMLGSDYNGVAHLSTNYETAVADANAILLGMDDYFDLGLSPNYIRTKPVMLSYLWSYTGIVGFYDAMLGESNVNVDYMDILSFPVTLCHEIVHAKGYSREYDANTIAVLACIESSRPDFRYAGYYYIFMNLYGIAIRYAQSEGIELPDYTSYPEFDMVRCDMRASVMYDESLDWNALTEFINAFSEDINDTYLESNRQSGGTDTYEVPPNIYVDFYYTYVVG